MRDRVWCQTEVVSADEIKIKFVSNREEKNLSRITITLDKRNKEIFITAEGIDYEAYQKSQIGSVSRYATNTYNVSDDYIPIMQWRFNEASHSQLVRLLHIINHVESIAEIQNQIYKTTDLVQSSEIINTINGYKLEDDFLLASAQSYAENFYRRGYLDAPWVLAQRLFDKGFYSDAFSAYQIIEESDPHYKEANSQLVHIIYMLFDKAEKGELTMTSEEKLEYQKAQLKFALNSGKQSQQLIDQIFFQLSGGKGLLPEIKNIGSNDQSVKEIKKFSDKLKKELKKYIAPRKPDIDHSDLIPALHTTLSRTSRVYIDRADADNIVQMALDIRKLREQLYNHNQLSQKSPYKSP